MSSNGERNLDERRKHFRVEWNSAAKIYAEEGRLALQCVVSNFSNGGAKIVGVEPKMIPDEFMLRISPHGRPHRCQVVWRSKDGQGVQFVEAYQRSGASAPAAEKKVPA
jgi:PilZ domain